MNPATLARFAVAAAVLPVPIGAGPRFHPPPGAHGACTRAALTGAARVHLELFAAGKAVVVPAAIGVRGASFRFGRVVAARCRMHAWTLDPSGVVRFAHGTTLGDLFAVWGQAVGPTRLLSFRDAVRLYRNGVRVGGDVRTEQLRDRDELVLEAGPYVPPHRSFRFPR